MWLYHGTNESRGKKILQSGMIKCDAERVYKNLSCNGINFSTTTNFAYFTNCIGYAFNYGIDNSVLSDEMLFYVFRLEIPEDILLPDFDELKIKRDLWNDIHINDQDFTVNKSLQLLKSVRINTSISLKVLNTQYLIVDIPTSDLIPYNIESAIKYITRSRKFNSDTKPRQFEILESKLNEFYKHYSWCSI